MISLLCVSFPDMEISIFLIPCVSVLILLMKTILQLTIPILQFLARRHFAWRLDSPLVDYDLVSFSQITSLDQTMSMCNIELSVGQYKRLGDEQVECVICLCDIDEGEEIRELRCEHLFHKACLDRWLEGPGATCPLCRDSLVSCGVKMKLLGMDAEELEDVNLPLVAYVHSARWIW